MRVQSLPTVAAYVDGVGKIPTLIDTPCTTTIADPIGSSVISMNVNNNVNVATEMVLW